MQQIEQTHSQLRIDESITNEFKNVLSHHMTNKKTQELVKSSNNIKIKGSLLNLTKVPNDEYVYIPTDWKLKPKQLTEHQIEKMAERKSDIPALYNDLSQSQDSVSIKEWSSNKATSVTNQKNDDNTIVHNDSSIDLTLSENEDISSNKLDELAEERVRIRREKQQKNELKKLQIDAVFPLEEISTDNSRAKRRTAVVKRYTNDTVKSTRRHSEDETLSTKRQRTLDDLSPKTIQQNNNDSSKIRKLSDSSNRSVTPSSSLTNKNSQQMDKMDKQPLSEKLIDDTNISVSKNESMEIIESSQSVISGRKSLSRSKKPVKLENQSDNEFIEENNISKNIKDDTSKSNLINFENNAPTTNTDKYENTAVLNTKVIINSCSNATINESTDILKPEVAGNETVNATLLTKNNISDDSDLNEKENITFCETETKGINKIDAKIDDTRNNCQNEPIETVNNKELKSTIDIDTNISSNGDYDMETSKKEIFKDCNVSTEQIVSVYEMATQPLPKESINENIDTLTSDENNIISREDSLSPILNKSANQSILSSLNCSDIEDRNNELINNTMNISPILENKMQSNAELTEIIDLPVKNIKKSSLPNYVDSPTRKNFVAIRSKHINDSPKSRQLSTSSSSTSMNSPCSSKVQYKGRAAQMITLANSKLLSSSPIINRIKLSTASSSLSSSIDPKKINNADESNQHSSTLPELTYEEELARNKDLLTFTKELPSPYLSPGISILKRKLSQDDTLDDNDPAQANKRKRVSFLDPPVSATKQFIRHIDENPIKTSINFDECSQQMQVISSNALKRKSRADSILEIAKFSNTVKYKISDDNETSTPTTAPPIDMESLQLSLSTVENIAVTPQLSASSNVQPIAIDDDISITPSPVLTFADKSSVLQYVFEEFSLQDIFKKYIESEQSNGNEIKKLLQSDELINPLTRELSNAMTANTKIKCDVLEELADKHSAEFLNYAVQENRSTDVLNRLSFDSIFDYVCDKIDSTDENMKEKFIENFLIKNNENKSFTSAVSNIFMKNEKIKLNVLEQLNDNNSEMLNYVIENNTNSAILDKLNFDSLLNYLSDKMQTNENIKQSIVNNYGQLFATILECINEKSNSNEHIKRVILKEFYKIIEPTDINDFYSLSDEEFHTLIIHILSNRKITNNQFYEYVKLMVQKTQC